MCIGINKVGDTCREIQGRRGRECRSPMVRAPSLQFIPEVGCGLLKSRGREERRDRQAPGDTFSRVGSGG